MDYNAGEAAMTLNLLVIIKGECKNIHVKLRVINAMRHGEEMKCVKGRNLISQRSAEE